MGSATFASRQHALKLQSKLASLLLSVYV